MRTFGQLVGHVTDYFYAMCALADGVPDPSGTQDFETLPSKAAFVEAVTDGATFCASVWEQATDDWLLELIASPFGEGQQPRVSILAFNTSHTNEHYACNIVTYMRVDGLVPPSSMPSP